MSDDLFEHEKEEHLTREQAAEKLRKLADQLAKQNSLRLVHQGRDVTVKVPDDVSFELEVEVETDGEAEIEVKITWEKPVL